MRFAIVGNPNLPDLEQVLERIERKAAELGIQLVFEPWLSSAGRRESAMLAELGGDIDFVLTLGGDGTLLRAARVAAPLGIPVLGCNFGQLGFLAVVSAHGLEEAMASVASGDYEVDERFTLKIEARVMGPDGPEPQSLYAVNDAVVHKGRFARLASFRVRADDEIIGQYSADGIILATATGSTAYSLSAGGPILSPRVEGIVVTPIAAHTLAVRPIIFSGDTRISVEPLSGEADVQLTIDGRHGCAISAGDLVRVSRSRHVVRLVQVSGDPFFTVLQKKMRWGDVREHPRARLDMSDPAAADPVPDECE